MRFRLISRLLVFYALTVPAFTPMSAAEPIVLETETGSLYGTFEIPTSKKPIPVALIISGSGPTDRDGNNPLTGKNDSLRLLAESLASKGVASIRYDKRGIAASTGSGIEEGKLRFETYVDDAISWCRRLRQDNRFDKLVVVGHSEGALVATIVCNRIDADGLISIAGSGCAASELIQAQLEKKLPPAPLSQCITILEKLKRGETTDKVPPELATLFRPSVQPYLISWFKYNPTYEISRLAIPILIVQGTTDLQVDVTDAKRLSQANSHARLAIVDGMNHVLKKVPDDRVAQMRSYGDPKLPLAPGFTDAVVTFIEDIQG